MRIRALLVGSASFVLHGASQAQQPATSTCKTSVALVPGAVPIPLKATAASVAVLDSAALSSIGGRTLSAALTARVPGVSVMRSSGVAGTGSRISIRGPSGVMSPQRPLLFIDGIRVDDEQNGMLVHADEQAPSRLDDIPLDAVACVQVLRGPAAAAAYGTDAAGGVILVTTRAPSTVPNDSVRGSAFADFGGSMNGAAYPLNFAQTGTPPNTQVSTWDPLRLYTPFRVGRLASVGGSMSATRGPNFAALVRGSMLVQDGSLVDNTSRRHTGGAALTFTPIPNVSLQSRAWLIHSNVRLPFDARLLSSTLFNGMPTTAFSPLTPDLAQSSHVDQTSARFGGGIDAEWKPAPWLVARAALGREDSRFSDIDTSPRFQRLPTNGFVRSEFNIRNTGAARTQRTSGTTSISAAYGPAGLQGATTLSLAYSSDVRRSETESMSGSIGDTTLVSGFTWRSYGSGDTRAVTVHQTLAWDNRRFIELGARHDDIGDFFFLKNPTYPFIGATWHLSTEPFFPRLELLSMLRLRAAYGEVGDRRDYDLNPLDFPLVIGPGPATGERIRRPVPRSRELESGIDVDLFDNRLGIEATWYRKRVTNSPSISVAPPSFGGSLSRFLDDAAWITQGTELSASAQLFESALLRANVAVVFSALRNKALTPRQFREIGSTGADAGYPMTSTWAQPFHFADSNGDGIIAFTEVTLDTGARYAGSSTPTRELGVVPSVTIARSLSIAAVLDYRAGFVQENLTEEARCALRICAALFDPSAGLENQARAVAGVIYPGMWFERGDFVRLREVNVAWSLPSSFAHRLGGHDGSVSVVGRNLAMWTKYPGLDPEVSSAGQASFVQRDAFTLPLARTFSMRLDLRW